jgi:hypothetical protein
MGVGSSPRIKGRAPRQAHNHRRLWGLPSPPLLCRCCRPVPPEKGSPATSHRIPQTVGAQGLEAAREGSVCTMFHCSVRYYTYVMVPPASPREREYHNKGVSFPAGTPEQRNTDPQRASGKTQRAARPPIASRPSMPATCRWTDHHRRNGQVAAAQPAQHKPAFMNDAG